MRFQSTPSAWRETFGGSGSTLMACISIHSLRVEGDIEIPRITISSRQFQSTPSAWRETPKDACIFQMSSISIHSLRVEGDLEAERLKMSVSISIHSLRVEGDFSPLPSLKIIDYFNPLPPRGGRRRRVTLTFGRHLFQSTPSAWRETFRDISRRFPLNFNPLPPRGGRPR